MLPGLRKAVPREPSVLLSESRRLLSGGSGRRPLLGCWPGLVATHISHLWVCPAMGPGVSDSFSPCFLIGEQRSSRVRQWVMGMDFYETPSPSMKLHQSLWTPKCQGHK